MIATILQTVAAHTLAPGTTFLHNGQEFVVKSVRRSTQLTARSGLRSVVNVETNNGQLITLGFRQQVEIEL